MDFSGTGYDKPIYQITDHLGSVRVIKDGEGTVLQRFDYYPFGSESRVWTAGTSTPQSALRYRFGGKEIAGQKVSVSTGAPAAAAGSPYLDYGARVYDPRTAAWLSQDPLSEKYYSISPYAYCAGNPVNLVDPDGKDGIFIVFPDYTITVGEKQYSHLGHAGVLLINPENGYTKYYEYGRYDENNKGVVRNCVVPDVIINEDGYPTKESLDKVLGVISEKSGKGGRIEGAYVKSNSFAAMYSYAEERMMNNDNPDRIPYSIFFNNCATFAAEVLDQDILVQLRAPTVRIPIPTVMSFQYQIPFRKVSYRPSSKE